MFTDNLITRMHINGRGFLFVLVFSLVGLFFGVVFCFVLVWFVLVWFGLVFPEHAMIH